MTGFTGRAGFGIPGFKGPGFTGRGLSKPGFKTPGFKVTGGFLSVGMMGFRLVGWIGISIFLFVPWLLFCTRFGLTRGEFTLLFPFSTGLTRELLFDRLLVEARLELDVEVLLIFCELALFEPILRFEEPLLPGEFL